MLADFIAQLKKHIVVEEKLYFANAAIIGGLDEWVRAETERELAALPADEDGEEEPPPAVFILKRLHHQWARYEEADTAYRRNTIKATRRLLEQLEENEPVVYEAGDHGE